MKCELPIKIFVLKRQERCNVCVFYKGFSRRRAILPPFNSHRCLSRLPAAYSELCSPATSGWTCGLHSSGGRHSQGSHDPFWQVWPFLADIGQVPWGRSAIFFLIFFHHITLVSSIQNSYSTGIYIIKCLSPTSVGTINIERYYRITEYILSAAGVPLDHTGLCMGQKGCHPWASNTWVSEVIFPQG